MRIGVLAHSFPRFAGDTHGPFVKRLSESLAARGHRVTALVPFDVELRSDPATPLEIRSFRYVWPDRWHQLGYSRTLKRDVGMRLGSYLQSPLYFFFGQRALARLVRERQLQLIHAHWILPNGYIAARACRRLGIPYAATLHGSDVFMAERNALFRRLATEALAGAAYVTSCSPELKDRLVAVAGGRWAEKVHLVANGTDLVPAETADATALRRRHGWEADAPLVVAVGRLVDKKGFDDFLKAGPALLAAQPAARLVIGGGGELRPELEALAGQLGIAQRVSFTGGLSHPEVLALIAAGTVFVMPSVRDRRGNVDGLPVVVLEAMAAARPIVASDVSGIPLAITDGETGLLVAERDPSSLAAAIVRLLAEPELGQRLGAAARQRVQRELNWPAIAAIHEELALAAVAAGGRRGSRAG